MRTEEIMQDYINKINNTSIYNYENKRIEMKKIVKEMFEDDRLEDVDFSWLIDNIVVPKLESYNYNIVARAEKEDKSTTEIILSEDY